jgi:hypothetical protein
MPTNIIHSANGSALLLFELLDPENEPEVRRDIDQLCPIELNWLFSEISKQAAADKDYDRFSLLINASVFKILTEEQLPEIYRHMHNPALRMVFSRSIQLCKSFDELHSFWEHLQQAREIDRLHRRLLSDIIESGPYTWDALIALRDSMSKKKMKSLLDLVVPMFKPKDLRELVVRVHIHYKNWFLKSKTYSELSKDAKEVISKRLFTGIRCLRGIESDMRRKNPEWEESFKQNRKRDRSPTRRMRLSALPMIRPNMPRLNSGPPSDYQPQ